MSFGNILRSSFTNLKRFIRLVGQPSLGQSLLERMAKNQGPFSLHSLGQDQSDQISNKYSQQAQGSLGPMPTAYQQARLVVGQVQAYPTKVFGLCFTAQVMDDCPITDQVMLNLAQSQAKLLLSQVSFRPTFYLIIGYSCTPPQLDLMSHST